MASFDAVITNYASAVEMHERQPTACTIESSGECSYTGQSGESMSGGEQSGESMSSPTTSVLQQQLSEALSAESDEFKEDLGQV